MAHTIDADKLHYERGQEFDRILDDRAMDQAKIPLAVPHGFRIHNQEARDEIARYDSFGRLTDQPGDNVRRKAITSESGQVVGFRNAEHDNRAVVAGMIIGLVLFVGVIYWLAYVGQQYPGF